MLSLPKLYPPSQCQTTMIQQTACDRNLIDHLALSAYNVLKSDCSLGTNCFTVVLILSVWSPMLEMTAAAAIHAHVRLAVLKHMIYSPCQKLI